MKYKYTIMMGSFFIILATLVVFIAVTRNYVDDMKFIAKTLLPLNFCEHLQKDIYRCG